MLKFFSEKFDKVFEGQPDGKGGDRFPGQSLKTAKFQSKSASEQASFCVHFKWPDLGPPMGDCPNQIFLVGQNPAPHGFFPCLP